MDHSDAHYLVLSGNNGGVHTISEVEVMAEIAKKMGLPESKIVIDPNSDNTWAHAIELKNILKESNLVNCIVTSAVQMRRSFRTFGLYFNHVVPLPSGYLYAPLEISLRTFCPGQGISSTQQ